LYVTSVEDVQEFVLDDYYPGARFVKIKYLLHAGIGAKRMQYRLFTICVGGYTAKEKHEHEHEIFILRGKALVTGGKEEAVCDPEDVIFIPSNETHQIKNVGDESVQFLCTKETNEIPELLR